MPILLLSSKETAKCFGKIIGKLTNISSTKIFERGVLDMSILTNTKILIFGSCVSRDVFNVIDQENLDFSIVDFFARTSLASLSCNPVSIDIDLLSIESAFQRRSVERDLNKIFFTFLPNCVFDVLLMDFVDDRFNLLMFPDGSGITESAEFKKSKHVISGGSRQIPRFSKDFFRVWECGWELLKNKLVKMNKLERILINKVYFSTHDDNGKFFKFYAYIDEANKYLENVYNKLQSDLKVEQFVNYKDLEMVSDSSHRWGTSPFHYTNSIYKCCYLYTKNFSNFF
jgi:hypothetical protein